MARITDESHAHKKSRNLLQWNHALQIKKTTELIHKNVMNIYFVYEEQSDLETQLLFVTFHDKDFFFSEGSCSILFLIIENQS